MLSLLGLFAKPMRTISFLALSQLVQAFSSTGGNIPESDNDEPGSIAILALIIGMGVTGIAYTCYSERKRCCGSSNALENIEAKETSEPFMRLV